MAHERELPLLDDGDARCELLLDDGEYVRPLLPDDDGEYVRELPPDGGDHERAATTASSACTRDGCARP
ncbi:MAG: hypothetical protein WKG01_38240 [Kofleriaceae bacterium]